MKSSSYCENSVLVSEKYAKTANHAEQKHKCTSSNYQTTWYIEQWCYKDFWHKAELVHAPEDSKAQSNTTNNLQHEPNTSICIVSSNYTIYIYLQKHLVLYT